jgi:hypothetical protein
LIFALSIVTAGRLLCAEFIADQRGVARSLQVFGNGLFFIKANDAGVGTDKALIKDASRQLAKLVLLQSLKHPGADFGGTGNLFQ